MDTLDILDKRVLFSAKTGSGKSRLMRYILSENIHEFSKVYVICPTESINNFYSQLVPKKQIFNEFNEEWLEKLLKHLTDLAESGDQLEHILLILDDCGSEPSFRNSKILQRIATRGRHLRISLWLSVQYIYMCPPVIRNQFDYVLCGQSNRQSLDILSDEFLFGDITRKEFQTLYHQNTRDFNFLVINTSSVKNSDDLNQIYASIKTPAAYV
jgi:hypothetical protein